MSGLWNPDIEVSRGVTVLLGTTRIIWTLMGVGGMGALSLLLRLVGIGSKTGFPKGFGSRVVGFG